MFANSFKEVKAVYWVRLVSSIISAVMIMTLAMFYTKHCPDNFATMIVGQNGVFIFYLLVIAVLTTIVAVPTTAATIVAGYTKLSRRKK